MKANYRIEESFLRITPHASNNMFDVDKALSIAKDSPSIRQIEVELHSVPNPSSSFIANLIDLKEKSGELMYVVCLINPSTTLLQVLEASDILNMFCIRNDFSTYSSEELIELFYDEDYADRVSDYLSKSINLEDDLALRDKLRSNLDSDDPILRAYSTLTLGKSYDSEIVDKIKEGLASEHSDVVRYSIVVLGWLGEVSAKDTLYTFLSSKDGGVAEAAAASIALLSDDTDSSKLSEIMKSSDKGIKIIAIQALSLINDDTSYRALIDALKDESDNDIKSVLISKLSLFNREEVADILINFLDDDTHDIREVAAAGLLRVKHSETKLFDILKKITCEDSWVGYFAVKAVGDNVSPNIAKYLMENYANTPENVQLAIIETLSKSKEDLSDFLMSIIDNPNDDIRKECLTSLLRLNMDKAKSASINLLEDPSWLVRYRAVEVLTTELRDEDKKILKEHMTNEDNNYVNKKIMEVMGD